MKDIPDESVDLILCDPPYGITNCDWDKPLPMKDVWDAYYRIAKENAPIVLFSAMPFTAKLVMSNLKDFKYMWVWNKHYARGFLNAKKQPLRQTENICVFYRKQCNYFPIMRAGNARIKGGKKALNRGTYNAFTQIQTYNDQYYPTDILDFPGVPVNQLRHSSQKPVDLLEYLVRTYTRRGDVVLDNCMGVGSTGVACLRTGREFIGIELDEHYYDIARERLRLEEATV